MMRLLRIACITFVVGGSSTLESASLPAGWVEIEAAGYHGPEGWFHDRESGALLRYWAGTMPEYVGARPTTGESCQAEPVEKEQVACVMSATASKVHVLIGPYNQRMYASYQVTLTSTELERRATELALSNPLATGGSEVRSYLSRDATEADLRTIMHGMDVFEVLANLGTPVSIEPERDGGFIAEFVIFSSERSPSSGSVSSSRFVTLAFSRERTLTRRPPDRIGRAAQRWRSPAAGQ